MTTKSEQILFTKTEVADLLKCHDSTIMRAVKAGKFPEPIRIAGLVRWRASDVHQHLGIKNDAKEAA